MRILQMIAVGALIAANPALAAVVVDTGAPSGGSNSGYTLSSGQYLAAEFSAPATTLTNLEGFIGGSSAGTFHVVLYGDGGAIPGAELFNMAATYNGVEGWHGVNGVNWSVGAGNYFVAFEVRSGDTLSAFMANPAPSPLTNYAFTNSGNYFSFPGLNVGVRISDGGTPAVPEPATWAMMLSGFGIVGGAMRYGRRKTTVAFG